ncbi:diguanylate cyclase [Ketobacter sp.]|uniref:GGDEF domain-containing protein n=1 Tax=Ketobacter sp. TaxID=2083498 RepID=UPI000F13BFC6|nr:diguanylate cyclase [Ketobacter sp.]RLT93455.1 MAG: GGDEF domain-containing protein [Ketobacter sp.]
MSVEKSVPNVASGNHDNQQDKTADLVRSELEGQFYVNRLRLRFDGALEARYRRYCGLRDRRYIRQLVNILIGLYFLYGIFDWMMLGPLVEPIYKIRYAMGMPGLIAVWFLVHTRKLDLYQDKLVVLGLFWLSVTTLTMVRVVPEEHKGLYLLSELAIIMAGITIGRMRFWPALSSAALFVVSYLLILFPDGTRNTFLLYYLFLSSGAVGLCLLAQYSADRSSRREFLQKLLIHRKNQQLKKLNSRLKDLAEVDPLTGIGNRRSFDQVLDEEWRRARRRGYNLAMLMCDIDYFKSYNDSFGHQQGDLCIKQVAQCMKQMVRRPGDLVARYGGEEFAVILPALDVEEAANIARVICQGVRDLRLPHPMSPVNDHVTISVGVAALVPDERLAAGDLVGFADEALYFAKKSGRNRIQVYRPEMSSNR